MSRILGCQLIEYASILLELPQTAAATGQVLFVRIILFISVGAAPLLDLVGGIIYLCTKLLECPRKLRHIIAVMQYLNSEFNSVSYKPLDVSSEEYHDLRGGILDAEIRILGKLGFEVHVEHPYGYLYLFLTKNQLYAGIGTYTTRC